MLTRRSFTKAKFQKLTWRRYLSSSHYLLCTTELPALHRPTSFKGGLSRSRLYKAACATEATLGCPCLPLNQATTKPTLVIKLSSLHLSNSTPALTPLQPQHPHCAPTVLCSAGQSILKLHINVGLALSLTTSRKGNTCAAAPYSTVSSRAQVKGRLSSGVP